MTRSVSKHWNYNKLDYSIYLISLFVNFYFQAASLLKRAEGIITLTVCNPNKKDELIDTPNAEVGNKTPKHEKKGKQIDETR